MKKLNIILTIMVIVCFAGTAVFLILSPDRVPVHYNFAGEADRIGSKFEIIIVPAVAAAMGVFFSFEAKQSIKKEMDSNAKIMLISGIFSVALLSIIGFYLMIKSAGYVPGEENKVSPDMLNKLVSAGIGILLIIMGNIIPKARRNSAVGIRTKWSMANDDVWRKSQRFGGFVTVTGGLLQVILSIFVPGMWNIAVMTLIITAVAVICAAASYRFYRGDKEKP